MENRQMTRTNVPMFTTAAEAANWSQPLTPDHIVLAGERGWQAAYGEACESVEAEYLAGVDADDTDALDQGMKAVADAVTNAWSEGLSHDEWVSGALRSLRRA